VLLLCIELILLEWYHRNDAMLIRSCAVLRKKSSDTSGVFCEEVNRNDTLIRSFDINGCPQTGSNSSDLT